MSLDAHNTEFVRLFAQSGLSAAEVARQLGIEPSTVSQYRSGLTRPSLTVLRLFSRITSEPLRLPGEAVPANVSPAGQRMLEPLESELIEALATVPLARRADVVGAFKVLLQSGRQEVPPVQRKDSRGTNRSRLEVTTDSASSNALAGQQIAAGETLPGISPAVADTVRGGALVAQRMARTMAREAEAKGKAASTSGSKGAPSGAPPAPTSPPSAPPAPVPARSSRRGGKVAGAETSAPGVGSGKSS